MLSNGFGSERDPVVTDKHDLDLISRDGIATYWLHHSHLGLSLGRLMALVTHDLAINLTRASRELLKIDVEHRRHIERKQLGDEEATDQSHA